MSFYFRLNLPSFSLQVCIARLSVDGKMVVASKFGAEGEGKEVLKLSDKEKSVAEQLRGTWKAILNIDIADDTDFFKAGAGSMDVVR